SYWKPGKGARAGAVVGTEGPLSGRPAPDGSGAPAAPVAASANDGLARIEGQIATLSAQIAHLHGAAGAGGADPQLEQIETAIDQSRQATNAEQDELERVIAPAGQGIAAIPAQATRSANSPAESNLTKQSGGLAPVPQSLSRNESLLRQLNAEI